MINKLHILFFMAIATLTIAQPKREMRAVWIAHVNNIDFPSASNLTESQQKAEFISIVNDLKKNGINAVIVQIRTNCDASYPSDLEPWSAFWAGRQGVAPTFDPLAFMIAECRKRGLEFHAWFNPYRAAPSASTFAAANHVRTLRPEWILAYNGLQMLDPALPEVRQYVTRVVLDVLRRYDVDAIHFDDYFYPYPVTGVTLNDDNSFLAHSRGFTDRAEWRRDNINLLIKMVSDSIKIIKPYVKFGISPFGIWKNRSASQPDGSETRGLEAFHSIFADAKKWVQEGWVDYIAPQIYWSIGFSVADFGILTPWWANNLGNRNRHLYIGHAAYRINNGGTDANWTSPTQMPSQIRLARLTPSVQGSIFYNTTTFRRNPLGFNDSLMQNLYKPIALIPTMTWLDTIAPPTPLHLLTEKRDSQILIRWTAPTTGTNEIEKVRYYVVYRFRENENININNSAAIRAMVADGSTQFLDSFARNTTTRYNYVVTAVDRLHNESLPTVVSSILISPTLAASPSMLQLFNPMPNPFSGQVVIRFQLEKSQLISLDVFDVLGRKIATLTEGDKMEGIHEEIFDGSQLTNGIYFIVLKNDNQRLVQRMIKN